MQSCIGSHNNRMENSNEPIEDNIMCNCPKTKKGKSFTCLWGGKCLKGGIYTADGLDDNGVSKWNYIGLTGGPIKWRVSTHYNTFKDPDKENHTKLSEEMWKEKREGNVPELRWKVVAHARVRRPNNKRCTLCSKETWYIIQFRGTKRKSGEEKDPKKDQQL